ncbi:acyltransferase [Stenotrophomonas sp. TWI1409]|uniref:acyltransferase n=1 Tax=unclassified Stenotrophomonas TaxID=196198 RepID=UPI003209376D
MKILTVLHVLASIPKSLYFNISYFGFATGCTMPVLVSYRVWLKEMRGTVVLPRRAGFGSVRIGFGNIGIFDRRHSRSIWEVRGRVVFEGTCAIGHGSKISVSGDLVVGSSVAMTAESVVVAKRSVRIGRGVLISWDVLIMDTDLHEILGADGVVVNQDAPVVIADDVWIGCRTLVLKGAHIGAGCIVAASSVVSGEYKDVRCLLAGVPAKVVRRGVAWRQ